MGVCHEDLQAVKLTLLAGPVGVRVGTVVAVCAAQEAIGGLGVLTDTRDK